jgi:hypothetical protein
MVLGVGTWFQQYTCQARHSPSLKGGAGCTVTVAESQQGRGTTHRWLVKRLQSQPTWVPIPVTVCESLGHYKTSCQDSIHAPGRTRCSFTRRG